MSEAFYPLALIIGMGVTLRFHRPEMESLRLAINQLVMKALLPALVFETLMSVNIDKVILEIPWVTLLGVLSSLFLAWLTFVFLPIPSPTKGAMILGASFGNVTYLGLPVLLETFPHDSLKVSEVSILFEVTKSTLNLTLGAIIAIHYGSREKITFRKTGFEALRLPPIWALFLALALKSWGLHCPPFILEAAHLLASSVSGLMMLSLGMALQLRSTRGVALVLPVALLKLIIAPLIMSRIVGFTDLQGVYAQSVILESAMPSQLLSFIISTRFQLDDHALALVIILDTLLAFVTLPWLGAHLVTLVP